MHYNIVTQGFPQWLSDKESACSAGATGDMGSIPGPGRCPGEAWQPTPIFLPGKSHGTEETGGLQSMGLQRVGHY